MSVSTDSLDVTEVAEHSLLPVPDSARTSTAAHQFWIWTGANIAPINWVLGALGIHSASACGRPSACSWPATSWAWRCSGSSCSWASARG